MTMHILLQDCATRKFYRDDGSLTDDEQNAKKFVSTVAAVEFALSHGNANAQVLLRFGSPTLDLSLPLKGCVERGRH